MSSAIVPSGSDSFRYFIGAGLALAGYEIHPLLGLGWAVFFGVNGFVQAWGERRDTGNTDDRPVRLCSDCGARHRGDDDNTLCGAFTPVDDGGESRR